MKKQVERKILISFINLEKPPVFMLDCVYKYDHWSSMVMNHARNSSQHLVKNRHGSISDPG